MKLLTQTWLYYLTVTFLVFIVGGFIFYNLLQRTIYMQIDEGLLTEKELIENDLKNNLFYSSYSSEYDNNIKFGYISKKFNPSPRSKTTKIIFIGTYKLSELLKIKVTSYTFRIDLIIHL
jgi:hypothetical protein